DDLSPTQFRSYMLQYCRQQMNIVVYPQCIGNGEQQGVRFLYGLVLGELFDQLIRFSGIASAKDRPFIVYIAHLITPSAFTAEIKPVLIIDNSKYRPTYRHPGFPFVSGCLPRFLISTDLFGLLYMERLAVFVVF